MNNFNNMNNFINMNNLRINLNNQMNNINMDNYLQPNNNINNLNYMVNKLNLDNNSDNSINITIMFGMKTRISKTTQKNKKLIEIFKVMQNDNEDLKKYIDNIREDTVNCNGEIIDITKTIDEINSEKEIITQNCNIVVPDIRTRDYD